MPVLYFYQPLLLFIVVGAMDAPSIIELEINETSG